MKRLISLILFFVFLAVSWVSLKAWTISDDPSRTDQVGFGNIFYFGNNNIVDVAKDTDGNFYVVQDNNSPTVRKYDSNWNFILEWGGFGTGDGEFDSPFSIHVDTNNNVYVTDRDNSRIQKFTTTGGFVTKWGSSGSGNGQFNSPWGIDTDSSGNVYVVDTNNHRVQKFTSTGTYISQFGTNGTGDGQFQFPRNVAIDSTGSIWVSENARIQKFNSSHSYVLQTGSLGSGDGQFIYIPDIALDTSDNLYATSRGNAFNTHLYRVQKFNSSGTFLTKWGTQGTGDGQFREPAGIHIDPQDRIYVTDILSFSLASRIQQFNTNGTFITKIGKSPTDNGAFNNPYGVVVDSNGYIYVADTNNNRIQKFNPDGSFLTKWGSEGTGDGQFDGPEGMTIDSSGYIWVTDAWNNRVQKFDTSGNFIAKYGTSGTGNGQFDFPVDVKFDSSGNIYVADSNNNRVQKFNSSFVHQANITGGGGGFSCPEQMNFDSNGNLYVADSCNNRVQKFNSSLVYQYSITGNGGDFDFPEGVAVDSSNYVYVADGSGANNRIQVFDSSGTYVRDITPSGDALGSVSQVIFLYFDAKGYLYFTEYNDRVQIFKFDRIGPSISLTNPPSADMLKGTVTFTGTASDILTPITTMYFNHNSQGWTTCSITDGSLDTNTEGFGCFLELTTIGTNTLAFRSTDSKTNTTTTSDYIFNVSAQPGGGGGGGGGGTTPGSGPTISGYTATSTSITLSFVPANPPVTGYILFYGTDPDNLQYGVQEFGDSTTTTYTVGSLAPNTTYYFQLHAVNNGAAGAGSAIFSARTTVIDSAGTEEATVESTPSATPTTGTSGTSPTEETGQGGSESQEVNINVVDLLGTGVNNVEVQISDGGSVLGNITSDESGNAGISLVPDTYETTSTYQGESYNSTFTLIPGSSSVTIRVPVIVGSTGTTILTPARATEVTRNATIVTGAATATAFTAGSLSTAFLAFRNFISIYSQIGRSMISIPLDVAKAVGSWQIESGIYAMSVLSGLPFAKRKKSGVVFDSVSAKPLGLAMLVFYSETGNLKTTFSDAYGKYSVEPKPDTYNLKVEKPSFEFPSKIITTPFSTTFGKMYTSGQRITVSEEYPKIHDVSVPLDPQELTGVKLAASRVNHFFSNTMIRYQMLFALAGLAISGYAAKYSPALINKVVLVALGSYVVIHLSGKLYSKTAGGN